MTRAYYIVCSPTIVRVCRHTSTYLKTFTRSPRLRTSPYHYPLQTCCALNHDFGDGPGTSPCDLDAVRPVLSDLVDAKAEHLWDHGLAFDARVFTGLKRMIMRGFDVKTTDERLGAIEAARVLFKWRDDATEAAETRQTGVDLLFWCALADLTDAVRDLIAAAGSAAREKVNRRLLVHRPELFSAFQKGMTPLHMAAGVGSSATVEIMLEAGADPRAISISGYDIVTYATAGFGDPQMFHMWAERFPEWDWNRRGGSLGVTPMGVAVQTGAEHKLGIIKALVAVGANPVYFADTGSHTLVGVAANPDISEETIRYLLSLPGVKDLVDVPMRPRTPGWRFRFKLTRLLVRLGSKKALFRAISLWEGQTALGSAALNGNAVAMKMLVREGGANTQLRNARGLKALDQARLVVGNQYFHPLLQPETFVPRDDSTEEDAEGKE